MMRLRTAIALLLILVSTTLTFVWLRPWKTVLSTVTASQKEKQLLAGVTSGPDLLRASNAVVGESYVPAKRNELTFNREIAPIIYAKCATCHIRGGVGPFPLASYREVAKRSRRLAQVVHRRQMPPWKPVRGVGEFLNDFSLSVREQGMIEQWLAEGAQEGAADKKIAPPTLADEWGSGPPDAIFEVQEPYTLSAEGDDIYRCFIIPTNYAEDRYVRLADIVPSNPKIAHHAILSVDTTGQGRALDQADPGSGYTTVRTLGFVPDGELGVWAPGMHKLLTPLPDGVGYRLPKGADLVLQMHYQRTGKEEVDRSRVGLYFCTAPVDRRVRCMPVAVPPKLLNIPAGDNNCLFWREETIPGDVTILQLLPHTHNVAREIAGAATLPGGARVPLIQISDWDFRWQNIYALKEPLHLPAGSKVAVEARFDNSAANPRNPNNPPKTVHFGERSQDEMCFLYLFYTVDSEMLTKNIEAKGYPDSFLEFRWDEDAAAKRFRK
ncbi:MAG: c-type cytochrome [Chthoniobacterales bacterium]